VGLRGNGKFANRANGGSCVKKVLMSGAALCLVAVFPAQAQDSIFGKLLKQVSRATGPTTAGAAGQPLLRPSATVQPTAEQTASLRAALLVKQPNTQIAQDVRDANALIERLAQTGACAVNNNAWNASTANPSVRQTGTMPTVTFPATAINIMMAGIAWM
jgi:hypothetical protein